MQRTQHVRGGGGTQTCAFIVFGGELEAEGDAVVGVLGDTRVEVLAEVVDKNASGGRERGGGDLLAAAHNLQGCLGDGDAGEVFLGLNVCRF